MNINQFKLFFEAGDKELKPLFSLDSNVNIKVRSWSKYETKMVASIDLDAYYLNIKQYIWEPFIEFNKNSNNLQGKNVNITYSDSSLMDCSFFPQYQNMVCVSPKKFRIAVRDKLIFTLSEQSFLALNILNDVNHD
ncbi:hypothetical protein HZS_15 [Henneguya salminicola]|nr:hypothetical protein HZS_15 [Henneguya salminicola]